jgi:hypothetical protein
MALDPLGFASHDLAATGAFEVAMDLPRVVFFGRTGEEALQFFNLNLERCRGLRLLDCPGGPGSLSALVRKADVEILAVDPAYHLPEPELEQLCRRDIALTLGRIAASTATRPDFDLEGYQRGKQEALELFLADRRRHPLAYRSGALPELPLASASFDLVLSGHLLFSYAPLADGGLHGHDGFDLAWHRRALQELLRVCRGDLRIYPAHTISRPAQRHPYLEPLMETLPAGWRWWLEPTPYDQGFDGEVTLLRIAAGP